MTTLLFLPSSLSPDTFEITNGLSRSSSSSSGSTSRGSSSTVLESPLSITDLRLGIGSKRENLLINLTHYTILETEVAKFLDSESVTRLKACCRKFRSTFSNYPITLNLNNGAVGVELPRVVEAIRYRCAPSGNRNSSISPLLAAIAPMDYSLKLIDISLEGLSHVEKISALVSLTDFINNSNFGKIRDSLVRFRLDFGEEKIDHQNSNLISSFGDRFMAEIMRRMSRSSLTSPAPLGEIGEQGNINSLIFENSNLLLNLMLTDAYNSISNTTSVEDLPLIKECYFGILQGLSYYKKLKDLALGEVPTAAPDLPPFTVSNCCRLSKLSITSSVVAPIRMEFLRTQHPELQVLELISCNLRDWELEMMLTRNSMTTVNSNNGNSMLSGFDRTLKVLNLRDNLLCSLGSFVSAFAAKFPCLQSLDLGKNKLHIECELDQQICKFVNENSQNLSTLDLTFNKLGFETVNKILRSYIVQSTAPLVLNLSGNSLSLVERQNLFNMLPNGSPISIQYNLEE
jgi:hypothetical protein